MYIYLVDIKATDVVWTATNSFPRQRLEPEVCEEQAGGY